MAQLTRPTKAATGTESYGANSVLTSSELDGDMEVLKDGHNLHDDGTQKWQVVSAENATNVPLVANNSSGTQDIANLKDNGTTVFSVVDGGYARGVNGAVATPTFSFLNDTNTGIYSVGADNIGISVGGTLRFDITGSAITSTLPHIGPVGSASAPSYAFTGDTNTGMYRSAGGVLSFTAGGNQTMTMDGTVIAVLDPVRGQNGSSSAPTYSFTNETNTGLYLNGAGVLDWVIGGTSIVNMQAAIMAVNGAVYPTTDNARTCGKSGNRWSEVWAGNGTIQTSHSSTKENIRDLSEEEAVLPPAVVFQRKKADGSLCAPMAGFLADDLPEECFAMNEDGTRSRENVYTSAVVGILCAKIRKLEQRLAGAGI